MVLEQTGKSSGFQVGKAIASEKNAEGALTAARSSLEIARAELEKTTITAPIAGIAVLRDEFRNGEKRKPMVGDTVWQNQPLLDLPDLSSMVVKTLVREVDLHKVWKGLRYGFGSMPTPTPFSTAGWSRSASWPRSAPSCGAANSISD